MKEKRISKASHRKTEKGERNDFKDKAITFLDLSADADYSLSLLSSLLLKIQPDEALESIDAKEVGHKIDRYLRRKQVLERVFLNRKIPDRLSSDGELKFEIRRIKALLR